MNYGQVRDQSLMLLNQFTLAGEKIARTYNNQADYLIRIPGLVDEAMQTIAAGPRRIQEYKELRLDPTRNTMGAPTYLLPDDLMDIVPGGLLVVENEYAQPKYDSGWARPDEHHIVFPKRGPRFKGRVFLEYYRMPRSIMDCCGEECSNSGTPCCTGKKPSNYEPPDCAPLDNAPETHYPIPYYVASHLVMNEDAFVYASLFNEWQSKLARLYQLPQPHRHTIEDAYGLDNVYDWGEY